MPEKSKECCCMKGKPMVMGIILFLIGILRYLGYDWNMVLMAVGVLLFLKGILLKLKK